jgi:hypothetical protein
MSDIAEGAAAGTQITQNHEGGSAFTKTFAYVWTGGFFADCVQFMFTQ